MLWYSIFSFLDYAVYSLVAFIVRLIMIVAKYDFFGADVIKEVASKVYVVLGVLMMFKIVISAIQYMINPDVFEDKDKGMGGLLKKIALCFVLLVLVQPIFNFAIYMQESIVSAIPAIILGNGDSYDIKSSNDDASKRLDSIGQKVAATTLKAFVTLKSETSSDGKVSEKDKDTIKKINDAGYTNKITGDSLDSFAMNIKEGCENGILNGKSFTTESCYYDYRIGISTVAGIFLIYILASMAFDIGIRAIKLGIIQILAPIPISSYIVSKDKLSKFFKLALNVYIDLFIRMGVIYFIIFFVEKVINSITGGVVLRNGYQTTGFETAFVKIIIIIALFMFAKNAPKFICEVLGINGDGGDLKSMFTRGGAMAGALINPTRNAVSNIRDAWKNNADMVDSRGGKLRRAIQNTRRVGNAARHGLGGAARGAVDGALGLAAGDNWSKMNERHRKAVSTSKRRNAEAFMKRTDNDARQVYKDQRKAIEKEFMAQGIDINKAYKQAKSTAIDKVNKSIRSSQATINAIRRQLASGTGTDEERSALLTRLNVEETKLRELSTKSGFDKAVSAEMTTAKNDLITKAINTKVASAQEKRDGNIERMAILQSELNDTSLGLSMSERNKKAAEYTQLMEENRRIDAEISDVGKATMYNSLSAEYDNQVKINTEGLDKQRDISNTTIVKGKIDSFFGGEGFTGKGYIDTADLLKNNRSALYTGEAMTKMRQNADVLVDASGNEATFTAKFTKPGVKTEITYSVMADLKRKADNGTIKPEELQKYGFENSAMIQSAFEDIEKQAAEAYVTANIAADDPTVSSKFKLKQGYKANSTIVEGINRLKAQIASANIPSAEKNELLEKLSTNPGDFFKGASDVQEKMRTKGSRISAYNSGKKDNGS